MSTAYKCDKCNVLFEKKEQEIFVPFHKTKLGQNYLLIKVGEVHDLCDECVGAALEIALHIKEEKDGSNEES